MLKEIIERNKLDQKLIDCGVKISGEEIHRDRAYLLGLVEECKGIIIKLQKTISAIDEEYNSPTVNDFLKKLESEGGE